MIGIKDSPSQNSPLTGKHSSRWGLMRGSATLVLLVRLVNWGEGPNGTNRTGIKSHSDKER